MKINEVSLSTIKRWGRIEHDEDDREILELIMPSALAHLMDYTGLTEEELDSHESLSMAYVSLCVFLYDNRSMNILNEKQNEVIQSFLDSHRVNLL